MAVSAAVLAVLKTLATIGTVASTGWTIGELIKPKPSGRYQDDPAAWTTDPNSPGYWKKGGVGHESGEKRDMSMFGGDRRYDMGSYLGSTKPAYGKYGRRFVPGIQEPEGVPNLYDAWKGIEEEEY